MKYFFLILIIFVCCFSANVFAAEEKQVPPINFRIWFNNVQHFQEVDMVKKGLERSEGLQSLFVSRASNNFVELTGAYAGSEDNLHTDISTVIVDMHTIQSRAVSASGVIYSLQKLL
mgnify:CR=1 FL=1